MRFNAELSPLAAYTVLWGLSVPLEMTRGALRPPGPWECTLLLLCLVAVAFPERKSLMAVVFSLRFCWWLKRLPMTWDSEVLAALTDAAVVLHVLVADEERGEERGDSALVAALGTSMRRQLGYFYWFAGFWKLNTSFMDHRYSCASIYLAQLMDAYVPPHMLSSALVQMVIAASPALTVVLECGVGALMLVRGYFPAPACGALGVLLATALQVGIDISPKPNNIASFSHKAALRYFFFCPHGATAALNEALTRPAIGAVYMAVGTAVLSATVAAQPRSRVCGRRSG